MSDLVSGSCLCGAVKYTFDRAQVLSAHHCHCKDCQRVTGSGKATFAMVPEAAIQQQGELKFYTVTGSDGSHVARGFCKQCGSGVMSYVEEMSELRFVKAGGMDDSGWLEVDSSFWGCSAQAWSPVDAGVTVFEKNPEM